MAKPTKNPLIVFRPIWPKTAAELAAKRCRVCHSPNCPYGIGPPLDPDGPNWYCHSHYMMHPTTVDAALAAVVEATEADHA